MGILQQLFIIKRECPHGPWRHYQVNGRLIISGTSFYIEYFPMFCPVLFFPKHQTLMLFKVYQPIIMFVKIFIRTSVKSLL